MARTTSHFLMPPSAGTRLVVALAAVACLALAGCNDEATETAADESPGEQAVADPMTLSGQWPLTGLPADGKAPEHPVMVVKIDNSGASVPQMGLGKADLVTEELVEGGTTRLAVFFYSQLPEVAGPVRSMRATDIGIVQPADAVLVASGGAPPTVRRVVDAKIETFVEGAKGYFREESRVAPYNLMIKLPELAASLKPPEPPADYLPWGTAEDFPRGRPAKRVSAVFSENHTTTWSFGRDSYSNPNSNAPASDQFNPATVLVLRVEVGDAGYLDPAGYTVPETKFTGSGAAMVFHQGRVVRGTWKKDGLDGELSLRTQAGELPIPPGRVWIELVPADGGNVTIG
ncbi:MAG: DUF3048 domain-containing protein [Nocardioidaceae bacterium]|nr:DUF3048 domain-containing protein [Nocardioidaceae bacterium]